MRLYILGAGPAGLALAQGVADGSDIPFTLIERQETIGGLAKTVTWDGYGKHDLGPHKIFTSDKTLMDSILALLPATEWLLRPKKSSIYMRGHYLPYPPSPFSLAKVYGMPQFAGMVADYGVALIRKTLAGSSEPPRTFEDDLTGRMGRKLYEALFKPMALKLWDDPARLDAKLSQGRIQTPSVFEVLGRLLKIKRTSQFEALEFHYPSGGLQKIWEAIEGKIKGKGECLLGWQAHRIIFEGNMVAGLELRKSATGEVSMIKVGRDDFVVSTLPLGKLGSLAADYIAPRILKLINDYVRLNDLYLVLLKIDKPSLLEESWVFVPDPEIVFHRLSEQESFDPGMTPGGSVVCCEIMSGTGRAVAKASDDELVEMSKKGLADMGYSGFNILDRRVIRIPASYPVFVPGYEKALDEILGELDRYKNFRTIGRQGAFNYIGTLDAMDIGYGAARWLASRNDPSSEIMWAKERARTRHYPVLD